MLELISLSTIPKLMVCEGRGLIGVLSEIFFGAVSLRIIVIISQARKDLFDFGVDLINVFDTGIKLS